MTALTEGVEKGMKIKDKTDSSSVKKRRKK